MNKINSETIKRINPNIISAVMSATPDQCLEWDYATNGVGYAQICITLDGTPTNIYVHRLAFFIKNGYLPVYTRVDGLIRHTCHNRRCYNPFHLITGTAKDNTQDAIEANRLAEGTKHGRAKLSLDDLDLIKNMKSAGYTNVDIAEKVGIHPRTLYTLLAGKSYKNEF